MQKLEGTKYTYPRDLQSWKERVPRVVYAGFAYSCMLLFPCLCQMLTDDDELSFTWEHRSRFQRKFLCSRLIGAQMGRLWEKGCKY